MIERVRVAGCGVMGSGIAEVVARAGRDVMVVELDQTAVAPGAPGARGANPEPPAAASVVGPLRASPLGNDGVAPGRTTWSMHRTLTSAVSPKTVSYTHLTLPTNREV